MDAAALATPLAAYSASVFAWVRGAHGFVYFDFVSIFVFLMLVGRWLQQKAVERFIRGYIFAVLGIALIRIGAWFWATGDVLAALPVLVSVLVVSCPCASGVALPLADDLAVSALSLAGHMNPLAAAILMPASSLVSLAIVFASHRR